VAERADRLRLVVLKNRKGGLREIGYHALLVVENGGVKNDFFDLLAEDERTTFLAAGSLALLLLSIG
jgi:hypothetical protein